MSAHSSVFVRALIGVRARVRRAVAAPCRVGAFVLFVCAFVGRITFTFVFA